MFVRGPQVNYALTLWLLVPHPAVRNVIDTALPLEADLRLAILLNHLEDLGFGA